LHHRRDPERRHPEVRQLIELLPQPNEIAAVERPLGVAVDALVIGRIAVGETVDDDEIENAVGPARLRLDCDEGWGGLGGLCGGGTG
jgi:hypothetical protein